MSIIILDLIISHIVCHKATLNPRNKIFMNSWNRVVLVKRAMVQVKHLVPMTSRNHSQRNLYVRFMKSKGILPLLTFVLIDSLLGKNLLSPSTMNDISYDNSIPTPSTKLLDFSASYYPTPSVHHVRNATSYSDSEGIMAGNGYTLLISNVGSWLLHASANCSLIINKLLHTPCATINLYSIQKLYIDNNVFVELYYGSFYVKDHNSE